MRKLAVFNHISVDGYFTDANGSMMWAKSNADDSEWDAFVADNTSGEATLVFGRITYQMMASYWPTPMAREHNAPIADRMNSLQKIVFSRTLNQASWSNTHLLKGDLAEEVRKLKASSGPGMVILGSGKIVAQLAQARLIDEYQLVVNPIVLGGGRTLFDGMKDRLTLRMTKSRSFRNGNTFLCYEPA